MLHYRLCYMHVLIYCKVSRENEQDSNATTVLLLGATRKNKKRIILVNIISAGMVILIRYLSTGTREKCETELRKM